MICKYIFRIHTVKESNSFIYNYSLVNKVKYYEVLLCISNNSIKHSSFV